jgi:hypothetical protein
MPELFDAFFAYAVIAAFHAAFLPPYIFCRHYATLVSPFDDFASHDSLR